MISKTVSADYLRHNLKDVVMEVLSGKKITLKYGFLGEIELVSKSNPKLTKKQRLVSRLKKSLAKKTNLPKPSYTSNKEMYADLYREMM